MLNKTLSKDLLYEDDNRFNYAQSKYRREMMDKIVQESLDDPDPIESKYIENIEEQVPTLHQPAMMYQKKEQPKVSMMML